MKCAQALENMLAAEPADLSPQGPAALALHLRSCAKCARVAATMRVDVHALAAVMPALVPAGAMTPWIRWPGLALACAASLLLFVLMRARPVPTVRPLPADAMSAALAQLTEPVRVTILSRTETATTPARRATSARYAMPDPVPFDDPADPHERAPTVPAAELAFNGVSASSNGRVMVLSTANPKITVIWFH